MDTRLSSSSTTVLAGGDPQMQVGAWIGEGYDKGLVRLNASITDDGHGDGFAQFANGEGDGTAGQGAAYVGLVESAGDPVHRAGGKAVVAGEGETDELGVAFVPFGQSSQ